MKHNISFLYKLSLLAVLCLPTVSTADDTEIYFDINQITDNDAYNPNVLFILDTSGSMTSTMTTVDFGGDTYDSTQTYGSSPNTNIYGYTEDLTSFTAILKTEVSCKTMLDKIDVSAVTFDPADPTYTGRTASYSSHWNDWSAFGWWSAGLEDYLECEDDENKHGQLDVSTDLYTAVTGAITINGRGNFYDGVPASPYSATPGSTIDWSLMQTNTFVTANYHDFIQAHSTSDTRTNVMKNAAKSLVDNFSDMNIGLMRFDGNDGGYVVHHFSDIDTDGANIKTKIDALTASGNTPLTETLWEARRYFKGLSVDWGDKSTSAAVSGSNNYNSPVENSSVVFDCQSNYVVYLTDGQPTQDSDSDSNINTLIDPDDNVTDCSHTGGTTADSTCLDEMSAFMAQEDYNNTLTGDQSVETYTIAFGLDLPLLQSAATANDDNGGYYTANNSTELNNAFDKILTNIEQTSTTFVAPAVSVNAFNSLQNRNDIYYALFEPNLYPRWAGNVKKYRINSKGAILGDGMDLATTTKDNDVIGHETDSGIDPEDIGYFLKTAESHWGGVIDGANATLGGAASQLGTSRTVYTIRNNALSRDNNIDLNSDLDNLISDTSKTDTKISNALLGIDETQTPAEILADRGEVIDWILGVDVKDINEDLDFAEASRYMSDPLHSRPVVVTYGGTEAAPTSTLFTTDNGGAFRAINTDNGQELFAFIPPELLKNQKKYLDNNATDVIDGGKSKFVYGLDGPMTIWREESSDPDIIIESGDQDHVYAYFGMRRGGNNYYAMNVTDTDDPQLMWTITPASTGFSDLGQTWSEPKLQKVLWGCGTSCDPKTTPSDLKDVLFFTGGYDPVHDTATSPTTGDKGAAIYMVDAETGALLWSAGKSGHTLNLTGMNNSIPGDLTVADINGDGAADIIFAIDIQGHVWRMDIDSENTSASNFATGGEIADLSDTSSASTFRRFYVGPTVSLSQKRGRAPFFVITVGSGYTAHPLNTDIDDRMYALFEKNVFSPRQDSSNNNIYLKIDTTQLVNMTNSASGPANPATDTGFYKNAEVVDNTDSRGPGSANGEKFLRKAITQQGITVYTSYIPNGSSVATNNATCGTAQLGRSRLYAVDFVTGASVYEGEYKDLKHPGIASNPVTLLIPPEGPDDPNDPNDNKVEKLLCITTECFTTKDDENPFSDVTTKILYWRENTQ